MDRTNHRVVFFLIASLLAGGSGAAPPADGPAGCPFMQGMGGGMHGMHKPGCSDGKDCPAMGPGMAMGHQGGHWMGQMEDLQLSPDQRAAIKQVFDRMRVRGSELAQRGSAIRRDFMDVAPDDPAYADATGSAAAATAALAADGVKLAAEVRGEIHGILTETQRQQLRERTDADRKRWDDWRQRHKPAE